MPWSEIISGSVSGSVVALIFILVGAQRLFDKVLANYEAKFNASLTRANDLHNATIALSGSVDKDLRKRRADLYAQIWSHTGILPFWPRNTQLTYDDLRDLCKTFRHWYFESGGMYLSKTARKQYEEVQKSLIQATKNTPDGLVDDDTYDLIREQCSRFRTFLTEDIHSRRSAPRLNESEAHNKANEIVVK